MGRSEAPPLPDSALEEAKPPPGLAGRGEGAGAEAGGP